MRGVVRDGDGRPLRDALVGVLGTRRSVRTGGDGTFRIDGVPAGTRTVEARSIGWQPLTFSMDFRTNSARDTIVSLGRHAQTLLPVTVLGRGTSASADANGFETRRRQNFGTFRTQEEIARHPAFDLIDVLAGIPGVHIEYGTRGFPTPYVHGTSGGFCVPNFFLDNMPFQVDADFPFDDLNSHGAARNDQGRRSLLVSHHDSPAVRQVVFDAVRFDRHLDALTHRHADTASSGRKH